MRELTMDEVELVSGGDGVCKESDPPPYSSGGNCPNKLIMPFVTLSC